MPDPADFDNEDDFMAACVPERIEEGDDQDRAVAACLGMWRDRDGGASAELVELATARHRITARRREKPEALEVKRSPKGVAEVFLYEEIDELFGITAKGFVDQLAEIGGSSDLTIRINSIGGSTFEAVPIYNALIRHRGRVDVMIDGVALSAASLVAMAGDRVAMADNGLFMIHDPWTMALGNAAEMRATADLLDRVANTMRPIYARRSKQAVERIAEMMAEETWFDAEEALAAGFVDEVVEGVRVAASYDPEVVRGRFRHPERLMRSRPPEKTTQRAPAVPAAYADKLRSMRQKVDRIKRRA